MERRKGLSTAGLRVIAMATMLADHIGAVFIERVLVANGVRDVLDMSTFSAWNVLYCVLRSAGRIAFPLYIFLMVEGFEKTRSRWKYALRLLILAVVSEIPFDLAVSLRSKVLTTGNFLEFGYQNVIFTLLIGFLCIWCLSFVIKKNMEVKESTDLLRYLTCAASVLTVMVLFMIAAWMMNTDYSYTGVGAISAMYLLRRYRIWNIGVCCAILTLMPLNIFEAFCFIAIAPVAYYNGEKGRSNRIFNYAFYPAHLLLLWLLALVCGYVMI